MAKKIRLHSTSRNELQRQIDRAEGLFNLLIHPIGVTLGFASQTGNRPVFLRFRARAKWNKKRTQTLETFCVLTVKLLAESYPMILEDFAVRELSMGNTGYIEWINKLAGANVLGYRTKDGHEIPEIPIGRKKAQPRPKEREGEETASGSPRESEGAEEKKSTEARATAPRE